MSVRLKPPTLHGLSLSRIIVLMMVTGMVPETVFFNELTWLMAREDY
jgi:hypothetical protein